MRKAILIAATLLLAFQGIAQEKYVVSANVALGKKDFDDAKENIDKAMASPETKDKPKAVFIKAQIYLNLQEIEKYRASNPYREGAQALFRLIELKPDHEKDLVDQLLAFCGFYYYNDGVKAYNDKKYAEAIDYMKNVIKIRELNGGKRFDKFPVGDQRKMDTIAATASQIMAMSLQNQEKYDEAIPMLVTVKNNPITRTPAIYQSLIYSYNMQKKSSEAFAIIQEARKVYPDDEVLRNYELNYFISSGKQDELVKKLEEAAVKEPNNADILFNLATTYLRMATPGTGAKPANAAELSAKSEDAFQRALKLAPNNAAYNYNFGALYFNQATEINDQMNAITGTSDAEQKKYDDLKAKREALFVKSMPYFEKAYAEFSATEKDLRSEDMNTYKSTISALKEIYARQNKLDKSAEMKKKLESL